MTAKTTKPSKGAKVGERPATRSLARTELLSFGDTDGERTQITCTTKPLGTVTPSTTISPATTRASSVDPPRQPTEKVTKALRHKCQGSVKDGRVYKKTSKIKKTTVKHTTIDFNDHSSDDEDILLIKNEYRRTEIREAELVLEFNAIKTNAFNFKMKALDEEYKSILDGTHPDYLEGIARLKEDHQKMQQLTENNREFAIQQTHHKYESAVLQARHGALHERRNMRVDILSSIAARKFKIIKEHENLNKADPEDKMIDLIVREDQVPPKITELENKRHHIFVLSRKRESKLCREEIESDLASMQLSTRMTSLSKPSQQPNNIHTSKSPVVPPLPQASVAITLPPLSSHPHQQTINGLTHSTSPNDTRSYILPENQTIKWANQASMTLANRINGLHSVASSNRISDTPLTSSSIRVNGPPVQSAIVTGWLQGIEGDHDSDR